MQNKKYNIIWHVEEQALIYQLKTGNDAAYRYLFDTYYVSLCQVAYGFLKDKFLAESIVSDAFFYLWEQRESIEIQVSVRAYLVRMVRNRCLNFLKQEYVLREHVSDLTDDMLDLKKNMLDSYSPMGVLLQKELESEVRHAIENLPKETQRVFKLNRFHELKYAEIAVKLNISINTVKYHMKKALFELYEKLASYLQT